MEIDTRARLDSFLFLSRPNFQIPGPTIPSHLSRKRSLRMLRKGNEQFQQDLLISVEVG